MYLLQIHHLYSMPDQSVRPEASQLTTRQAPTGASQKAATSVAVDAHQHSVTSSSEIPVLQPPRPTNQLAATQSVTATSDKPLLTNCW